MLRDQFDRLQERKTLRVNSENIVDFHGQFAKGFRFTVPVHPRNLSQLIHPHQGYLCNFKNRGFSFPDMLNIYQDHIASSREKFDGRDLLSEELSCLSFWCIVDEDKKGYLTVPEAKELFEALRFDIRPYGLDSIKDEFKWTHEFVRGKELNQKGEPIIRFDFVRQVFLDHG
eukprot:CAMPEP_0176354532 /NCGR_PEP_ID=MMETSP0126-20121128/12621_1 /TAXON_ID=141414 ORGANISM="Strombidinopsis acuminatum, Strain SPMC142" /NCGR_SAMPLE_ID=MMETSP0126 /ASSEMBLY_ACC=CAM_ASM_000229 /LENGTH=171 /DNA_ID=CAMNT_0017706741 /DNA_START=399 /DNA_END=910 /DNA_ORIENTATION=-